MSNWLKYILISIGVLAALITIIIFVKPRKEIIQYDAQDFSDGITDEEADSLAAALWDKIDGWKAVNMEKELTELLSTNNQDFVKVYNSYYELTGNSLKSDLSNEWFYVFGNGYVLASKVLERMETLNLQ